MNYCHGNDSWTMSHGSKKQVRFHTFFSFDSYTATTTYTGYCGLYDTVQIEKWGDGTEGGIVTDWFEGRMVL